jgi:molybdopterin synthase sulfur carrier subunit
MKLLYFAWVREKIGRAEEDLDPPPEVRRVSDLLDWLRGLGPEYRAALADAARIRVAVNQAHAKPDAAVGRQDEVAIFPPVTGG